MPATTPAGTRPLSERKADWFFVVAFSFFSITSIVTDAVNGLNGSLDPDSSYIVERFIYDTYASVADPLLVLNPPQVRWSAFISAFVWLPLYIYFILGFVRGWNSIRVPGLVYGGALTHGMITYMAEGLFGFMATEGWADPALCPGCTEPQTWLYLLANSPYLLVPLLMIVRMWKPHPFGEPVEEPETDEGVHLVVDVRCPEPVVSVDGTPVKEIEIVADQ